MKSLVIKMLGKLPMKITIFMGNYDGISSFLKFINLIAFVKYYIDNSIGMISLVAMAS